MTTAHFDQRARDWDSDPLKVERALRTAEAMRRALPLRKEMRALEYGAGTGLLSFALQHDLASITLADTSPGMLEVLAEKIAGAGITHMRPVRLDLSSDSPHPARYDLIYSLMVMHHIPDTQQVLSRFADLLQPSGYLCICDLDREDGTFHKEPFDGHPGFERDELRALVELAGFQEVKLSTACEIHRDARIYPLFLLTARKPG